MSQNLTKALRIPTKYYVSDILGNSNTCMYEKSVQCHPTLLYNIDTGVIYLDLCPLISFVTSKFIVFMRSNPVGQAIWCHSQLPDSIHG